MGPPGRSPPLAGPGFQCSGSSRANSALQSPWCRGTPTGPGSRTIGGALSLVAGALGKIALDVILMAQTEVGEVAEPAGEGRGGSSTLPHKRNPILSVTAAANVRRVQALAQTLYGAMVGEHERAAGVWHAEWEALSDALVLTGGAAAAVREVTEGLGGLSRTDAAEPGRDGGNAHGRERHDGRRGSPRADGGPRDGRGGRPAGRRLWQAVPRGAPGGASPARTALGEEIDAALDPKGYLGSAGTFIDRALNLYREEVPS